MAHTSKDKVKLLARVRRIAGQVAAIETALAEDKECGSVLQLIASCRGAMGGLMSEVVEGHIRCHVMGEADDAERDKAAQELIDVLKPYLK
jgi:DNA-binding FrmR family transcriptional regulator